MMPVGRYRIFFEALLVFFLSVALFSLLERHGTFPDPDSFYHAKMGSFILREGALHQFPWLPLTILRDHFVDHHFLYHLALVPFIAFAGSLLGTTIATIFFAGVVFATFHFLLRAFAVRYAPFFILLLALATPFVSRMGIAKASAPSVFFFLLLLYALWCRRLGAIAVIAFLYVWLFDGWPIALVLGFSVMLGQMITDRIAGRHDMKRALTPMLAGLVGLLFGIIVNPYFPDNLSFFWSHIVRIALFRPFVSIPLGREWGSVFPMDIAGSIAPAMIALLFSFALFLFSNDTVAHCARRFSGARFSPMLFASGISSAIFFIATLTAERHIEYFIPSTILFTALLFTFAYNDDPASVRGMLAYVLPKSTGVRKALVTVFFVMLFVSIARDLFLLEGNYRDGYPWTTYQRVAHFLQNNTPKNALILNARWDDFPMLFFWDDWHRYGAGLDPTFSYLFDKKSYERFIAIRQSAEHADGDIAGTMKHFGATMLFVRASDTDLIHRLQVAGFREQYHDNEGSLYAQ